MSRLGKGSYGAVYLKDKHAVKQFKKLNHLIQEYAAGKYLESVTRSVNHLGVDFENKTITMELFRGSLRHWLVTKKKRKQIDKMAVKLICAIFTLHELRLIHADVKPGNILVNWDHAGNITNLVLGDLGFVAPSYYAKVERTAGHYREKETFRDRYHDIYSAGIILLEVYGSIRVSKQLDYIEIPTIAREVIADPDLRKLIVSMCQKRRDKRPTCERILKYYKYQRVKTVTRTRPRVKIVDQFSDYLILSKQLSLGSPEKGFEILNYYLSNKKSLNRSALICAVILIIYSIFEGSRINIRKLTTHFKISQKDILVYLNELLHDRKVLELIYC